VAVYRRSARPRFVLLLLVLTAITLVTLDTRANGGGFIGDVRSRAHDAFAPIQDATHSLLRPVGDFFTGALRYSDLKKENARLRDQLAKARNDLSTQGEAQRQLKIIAEEQHLPFAGDIPTILGQVVDTSSSNFEVSIQINRGTDSGVAKGMPVVAAQGLVGLVAEVSAKRSTVLLLTDPTFSVGVRVGPNPVTGQPNPPVGVANGTGRDNPMRVDLVPPNTALNKGDYIYTSGLQLERFPKDILVGRVASVKQAPGALQEDVTITPAVDLSRLEFVAIMQWSPQTPTSQTATSQTPASQTPTPQSATSQTATP
jgi:rod shape-determining protein MreC